MTASMAALVETMKKELDRQAQAMTALSATVAKLTGRLGVGGSSTGEEQVADTKVLLQIARTHPALVQLLEHNNNPHTLCILVLQAVSFDFAPEQGIAAVTWQVTQESKESEIHTKIHTGASEAAYAEGEAEFYKHVTHLLNLASKYSVNAARYSQQRNNQREAWT
eukprot:3762778-Rhodomonas_salina.3